MGSTKFQIIICLFFLLSVKTVFGMDIENKFNSLHEVHNWADKFFFGGYSDHKIEKNNKHLLVLLGMKTSGFLTSQVLIYHNKGGDYELVAFRNTVLGSVDIQEDPANVYFNVDGVTVLSLSWGSIQDH